jgi:hypothetical protein
MLHIAAGWEYRHRYVTQCPVIYCAFEGAHGYKKRISALRKHYNISEEQKIPLYLLSGQANLAADHADIVEQIREAVGDGEAPGVVVLDTLNKSLFGSESKDQDMGAYVRAAEAIRDAFQGLVIIVHHCGWDDTRPRGHSSLPGAVDAQIAITRQEELVSATVEMMRDGAEGTIVTSRATVMDTGYRDARGAALTSLVLVPAEEGVFVDVGDRDWSKGFKIWFDALREAIKDHGEMFQAATGELPHDAVELEHIKLKFETSYPSAEANETKRQDAVRKAFQRHYSDAQAKGLIKTHSTPTKRRMVWLVR